MTALLIGYPRCSTDQQDLTVQRDGLLGLGVGSGPKFHETRDIIQRRTRRTVYLAPEPMRPGGSLLARPPWRGSDHQHWAGGVVLHPLRRAAHQHRVTDPATATGDHHQPGTQP